MTEPYYTDDRVTVLHGDCLQVMAELADASVDAVVTDPPYSLGFMSAQWDTHRSARKFQQWCEQWAAQCLRVLKPGGHLLAFGGTRTWHRLTCAIEDAGFEIRDSIAWMYGSGFPKSLDVSKAIDKAAGAEREVVGPTKWQAIRGVGKGTEHALKPGVSTYVGEYPDRDQPTGETAPATDAARQWQGWGTALKPAHEPVVVARKPLTGTVAQTVLQHGTGALNIDGCRIEGPTWARDSAAPRGFSSEKFLGSVGRGEPFAGEEVRATSHPAGRWPANVVLDETQAAALDQMSGEQRDGVATNRHRDSELLASEAGWGYRKQTEDVGFGSTGGASRFFYTAKADSGERITYNGISHATVKPLSLMRWLVRLVTPPGGVILEPFAGSGTTVEAALLEGFRCVAIEREADYLPLITQRIHRRRDPIAYLTEGGHDLGLFDLDEEIA